LFDVLSFIFNLLSAKVNIFFVFCFSVVFQLCVTVSSSRYAGLCAVGFERWQKALRGGYYMLCTFIFYNHVLISYEFIF